MEEILKKLFKDNILTEDTKKAINEAFSKALNEAKAAQREAIRAELTEQYKKDREQIHEALSQWLDRELNHHVSEIREGMGEIDTLKAKYAKAITEVRADSKKYVAKKIKAMEMAIEAILHKEISELHEDEKKNRKAYLLKVNEKVAELASEQQKFRAKGAAVLENIINVRVANQLEELREDIQAARQADFGRDIFEAFMNTYRRQFFNSTAEIRSLVEGKKAAEKKAVVVEEKARNSVAEANRRAALAEASRTKLEESVTRQRKIGKLLEGLRGSAREQMKTLLEATKTADLEATFRKHVPNLLKESPKISSASTTQKGKLAEAVVELRTGGRETVVEQDDDDIVDLRRRAGTSR